MTQSAGPRTCRGIPAQLLPAGHPFGVLTLEEHITARCVRWAAAFARSEIARAADGGSARLAWMQALHCVTACCSDIRPAAPWRC